MLWGGTACRFGSDFVEHQTRHGVLSHQIPIHQAQPRKNTRIIVLDETGVGAAGGGVGPPLGGMESPGRRCRRPDGRLNRAPRRSTAGSIVGPCRASRVRGWPARCILAPSTILAVAERSESLREPLSTLLKSALDRRPLAPAQPADRETRGPSVGHAWNPKPARAVPGAKPAQPSLRPSHLPIPAPVPGPGPPPYCPAIRFSHSCARANRCALLACHSA